MDLNGLPSDLAQFVEQELAAGKYQTEADLVCEAVRLLCEREKRLSDLRSEILPALAKLDQGNYTAYDEQGLREMIDDVKARGRTRLAERRSTTP
jgi:putative addiction module CopG family antidote